MGGRVVKRLKYLIKRHIRGCINRVDLTRCDCAWSGRYLRREVVLSKWARKQLDPRVIGPAAVVLRRFITAIDDGNFDRSGERSPLGTGQTFAEFVDEWRDEYAIKEGLSMDSLASMLDVLKASALGRMTLEEIAGGSEVIHKWLNTAGAARKWKDKTWNEYHGLINRICDQAIRWKRGGKPRMVANPMASIGRRAHIKPKHFRRRVLLEDVEDRLFAVCDLLDRPQHLPNRNKLTQAKADAIRAAAAAGRLQKNLAAEYRVSPSVICAIVKGSIWNAAQYRIGTKGREMRRRLMAGFDCGLRPGEMLKIQIKHIDWRRTQSLTAADGTAFKGYRINLPADMTKGGKWTGEDEEVIVGTLRLSQEIEARRFQLRNDPDAFIFGTEAGRSQVGFNRMWRELFRLAGLEYGRDKGLVWYTTRHEFISRVAETAHPLDAQKAARHGDLKTTQGYMHTRNGREWTVAVGLDRANGAGRR
jgi:integrase